jgi:hypothetical protein
MLRLLVQTIGVLISTTIWSCQSCPRIWWPFPFPTLKPMGFRVWPNWLYRLYSTGSRWAWIQEPASSPIFYTVAIKSHDIQSECYSTYMYDILWPFMVLLRLWSCPYIHLCKNSNATHRCCKLTAWYFFPCAAQWHLGVLQRGEGGTRLRTYT